MTTAPLVWNVYIGDWNHKQIKVHNIFEHGRFAKDVVKTLRKAEKDWKQTGELDWLALSEGVRRDLMYYYWSKCEWEVVVSEWPPREKGGETKIDVYEQVRLNWDVFLQYLWEERKELYKWVKTW